MCSFVHKTDDGDAPVSVYMVLDTVDIVIRLAPGLVGCTRAEASPELFFSVLIINEQPGQLSMVSWSVAVSH